VIEPALAAQAPAPEPPAGERAFQPGEPVQEPAPEPNAEQPPAYQQAGEAPAGQPGAEAPADGEATLAPGQPEVAEPDKSKQKRQRKEPKAQAEGKEKKLSALDAAAQVLAQADAPMSCQELIVAMAAQGLWSSPAGKTPSATLSSALLRELQTKGEQARFVKVDRGKFALRSAEVRA
jgi:hypothetical protein